MKVSELAQRAGIAPSAVRWYESVGILPPATRQPNGYREYADDDLARLRLVVSLRRLGLGPEDAGRMARLCLERGQVDRDLAPLIAVQRQAIARQRDDLDRLDGELIDLEFDDRGRRPSPRPQEGPNHARGSDPGPLRVHRQQCPQPDRRGRPRASRRCRLPGLLGRHQAEGREPLTVRVLADGGIDWSGARSKSVDAYIDQSFDYVITVCDRARQSCPVFPGQHNTLHWGLDDPAEVDGDDEARLAAFRKTYLDINQRIRPFIEVALRAAGRGRRASIAD